MSAGCGAPLPFAAGTTALRTTAHTSAILGQHTDYRLSIPSSYSSATPTALVLVFHGWGGSSSSGGDFHTHGIANGYLVATPGGYADGGQLGGSWKGGGTSDSPGALGATCVDVSLSTDPSFPYEYASCGCASVACPPCDWTTCEDSVAQALAVVDEISAEFCVDSIFAAGSSNGAMFTFALAYDPRSASVFDGYFPMIGQPHAGFVPPLLSAKPLLFSVSEADTTVPPLHNPGAVGFGSRDANTALDTAFHGWYYSTARNASSAWAASSGCDAGPHAREKWGSGLTACVEWRGCTGGVEVSECTHPGGHNNPSAAPQLLHDFMLRVHALGGSGSRPSTPPQTPRPASPPLTPPQIPRPATPPQMPRPPSPPPIEPRVAAEVDNTGLLLGGILGGLFALVAVAMFAGMRWRRIPGDRSRLRRAGSGDVEADRKKSQCTTVSYTGSTEFS